MKKIIFPTAIVLITMLLSGCTLPWQAKTPETETVVENGTDVQATNTAPTVVPTPEIKDITPSDTPKAIAEGGIYMPYTTTAVAQAKGQVVLFFHANWCPTCIAVNKDIEANLKTIPTDLTILKVNYDDEKELRELYAVTEQHTFVQVDNSGKLIKKWRGGTTLAEVVGQVQK